MADTVGNRQQGTSEDVVESEDEWVFTARRLERLDARERAILAMRYGLEGDLLTFKEIGRRFGMTGEWARRLELRALRKLGDKRCDCPCD